jgi:hypothetical protein
VEECNFKILMSKKFRAAGDCWLLKVSILKVNNIEFWGQKPREKKPLGRNWCRWE